MPDNPLLSPWPDNAGLPPFGTIRPEHFRPAFDVAMADHLAAVSRVATSIEPATFDNTIVPLERAALDLSRVDSVFGHLTSADTSDALQAIEREMAPLFAAHSDAIFLNQPLFRRIEAVWQDRGALGAEEARVLDRYHTIFQRAGAGLDAAGKTRLAAINERLADARHAVRPERARRREALDAGARRRGRSRRPARLGRGRRGRRGERARICPASTSITLGALLDRALPHLLDPARPPREGVRGLDPRAARPAATATTARSSPRSIAASYRGGAAPRLSELRPFPLADTMAKTPEAVAGLLETVWERGRARGAPRGGATSRR